MGSRIVISTENIELKKIEEKPFFHTQLFDKKLKRRPGFESLCSITEVREYNFQCYSKAYEGITDKMFMYELSKPGRSKVTLQVSIILIQKGNKSISQKIDRIKQKIVEQSSPISLNRAIKTMNQKAATKYVYLV